MTFDSAIEFRRRNSSVGTLKGRLRVGFYFLCHVRNPVHDTEEMPARFSPITLLRVIRKFPHFDLFMLFGPMKVIRFYSAFIFFKANVAWHYRTGNKLLASREINWVVVYGYCKTQGVSSRTQIVQTERRELYLKLTPKSFLHALYSKTFYGSREDCTEPTQCIDQAACTEDSVFHRVVT